MAFLLQPSHEAVDDLGVHAFENPGVVGVEQADATSATPREGARPKVGSVAHLAGNLADPLGCFRAAAIRAIVAAQNSRHRGAGDAGALGDFVNRHGHTAYRARAARKKGWLTTIDN